VGRLAVRRPAQDPRSCIRVRSQEDVLKRTKIVLALPSYNRQRLSGIRRGWCPWRPRCGRTGVPFRLWLCSPPVVEWPRFISREWPSQGETTVEEARRKASGVDGFGHAASLLAHRRPRPPSWSAG